MEFNGKCGTETSQHPWSPMDSLVRRPVSIHESHGEVWKLVNTHGVHEELVKVDFLMECHEEFVVVSAHS